MDEALTYEQVAAFREAMADDGWDIVKVYPDEDVTSYCKAVNTEGWVAHLTARPIRCDDKNNRRNGSTAIHIWRPDGCTVISEEWWYMPNGTTKQYGEPLHPIREYSMDEIRRLADLCPVCGKSAPGELRRVAFANLACPDCLPALRAKLETKGWYN